eukprot:SAG25_NODE_6958_length_515_cov_1.338942_2_plen_77_part_01
MIDVEALEDDLYTVRAQRPPPPCRRRHAALTGRPAVSIGERVCVLAGTGICSGGFVHHRQQPALSGAGGTPDRVCDA